MTSSKSIRCLLAVAVASMAGMVTAAEPARPAKPGQYNPEHQTVDVFEAQDEGTISVRVIPKDDTQATLLVENKSKQPLNVRLPEAFAMVHAQFGGGGGGLGGGGGGGGQGLGGGGGGGLGGAGGGGGGFFNVAPEKVGKVKIPALCLDHGRPDPQPRMHYEIRPVDTYVKRPAVVEVIKLFAAGKLPRQAAQAATWHLNNDVSWAELASKTTGRKRLLGGEEPYFTRQQIAAAMQIASLAATRAKQQEVSPGKSDSLSKSLSKN